MELFPASLEKANFTILPINLQHLEIVSSMPLIHRDPFDRLLIAQAQFERVPVLTMDKVFTAYGVPTLWLKSKA